MNVKDLQKEYDKWTAALSEMKASQEQDEKDLASLETERRSQLVGACAEKDSKAQDSLRDVNQRIEALHGAQRDKAHAIEAVSEKVARLCGELATATRKVSAQAVCGLIDAHLKAAREVRLEALVKELSGVVQEVSAGEQDLANALGTLGTKYAAHIERLNNSSASLATIFKQFREQLPHVFSSDYVQSQLRGDADPSFSDASTGFIESLRRTVEIETQN